MTANTTIKTAAMDDTMIVVVVGSFSSLDFELVKSDGSAAVPTAATTSTEMNSTMQKTTV